MLRVVLPNCLSPLLVQISISFAAAILVEAALAFLGLGVQPPTPSWGAMLDTGRRYLDQTPWYSISAGAAIFLAVLTALEVGTYFVKDPSTTFLVATLFPMMFIKFAVVCGVFMHLRFDNPLLRRVFIFGLILAVAVYVVVLTSMEFWSSSFGG